MTDRPSPTPDATGPSDAAFEATFARGDDRATLEALMDRYGEAVLAHCRTSLADLGDPSLGAEARHDTFIEAFRSIGPLKALPDPEGLLMRLAAEQCRTLRRLEKTRGMPREPLEERQVAADWKSAVRWEIDVILEERPEGPDRMAKRSSRRRGPSIWPALLLGVLSVALLLAMWRWS